MSTFTPLSTFYLIKDVNIDISNHNQYYFESEEDQNAFFMSKVFKTVDRGTYQRKNSLIMSVPFLADDIRECKYLAWKNDVSNKWYYAFVTSIDYVNPNVSDISYIIDTYQTYLFDIEWKESFIERKHCKQYDVHNKPILNEEAENIDYGSSYRIIKKTKLVQIPDISYVIMAFSEPIDDSYDIGIISQNVQGIPTNLWYYIFPIYTGSQYGENVWFSTNGVAEELTTAKTFMAQCTLRKALVGKMVSCIIVPFLTFGDMGYGEANGGNNLFIRCDNLERVHARGDGGGTIYNFLRVKQTLGTKLSPFALNDESTFNYGDFYELGYTESKLYNYPYSFTELATNRGDTFIIRNEYLLNDRITVEVFGTLNFQNKMSFIIKDYLEEGIFMENGIHDSSNSSLPIIDDYSASYLQSNSNSIAVARSNALATMQTSVSNAETRYAQSSLEASASYNQGINSAIGDYINAWGNIVGGSVIGATSSISSMGVGYLNTSISEQTSQLGAMATYSNSLRSSLTDYQNSLQTVLAKYQDAEQTPSNVRSMGGDYLYNIANDCNGIYLLKKSIMPEIANKLQSYMKMYGYAYNRVEIPEFHSRESWNYLKISQPNISGNIPSDSILELQGIFQKGITLWHGDYIGDYTRSNAERRA